jgi:uncharacterized protein YukJ
MCANTSIIAAKKTKDSNSTLYFRCVLNFEAPIDSKHYWINNALFLCEPDFNQQFQGSSSMCGK